jgi:hypothetical protein
MNCDWNLRTLEFSEEGQLVKLQGLKPHCVKLQPISSKQVYKSAQGNEIWAYALIDHTSPVPPVEVQISQPEPLPPPIQDILLTHADVFQDPKTLPPHKTYDHSIPLILGSVPVNSKPYYYSPHHKSEIERQVQELLEAGLIEHNNSPFASPVLLVKKKMGHGDYAWIIES